jgi:hypothetical protein
MHPTTDKVKITGKIWTIDSWDNESFTVDMRNQNGVSIASREYRAQHSSTANGQTILQCEGTVGGWQDGYFELDLEAEIDETITEVHVYITNTLD